METASYLRSTASAPEVNTSHADAAKLQILKSIKTKFYIHKSFDVQSDLEFMPHIPSEMTNDRTCKKPNNSFAFNQLASPIHSHNIMYDGRHTGEYYPNPVANGMSAQHYNINDTPKSRMAYLNQSSPKRTSPSTQSNNGTKSLRRKVTSNPKSFIPSSGMHSASPKQYPEHNEYYYGN